MMKCFPSETAFEDGSSLSDFHLFRSRSTKEVAGTRVILFYKLFHELPLPTFLFKSNCRIKFASVSNNYK